MSRCSRNDSGSQGPVIVSCSLVRSARSVAGFRSNKQFVVRPFIVFQPVVGLDALQDAFFTSEENVLTGLFSPFETPRCLGHLSFENAVPVQGDFNGLGPSTRVDPRFVVVPDPEQ